MMTNLLGRRARGQYFGINPKYDVSQEPYGRNARKLLYSTEGEIVAVDVSDNHELIFFVLDSQLEIRRLCTDTSMIVPRELEFPLR